MEAKINKEQLAYISNWIKERGVNYYDVNMEMTDHLALEIEELMQIEHFKFYEATKKAFSRYKRFHFMNIEEEKSKELQKQSWKEFKRAFIAFFTFPKAVITLLIFMGIYSSISFFDSDYLYIIFVFIGVFLLGNLLIRNWMYLGKRRYLQLVKYNTFMVVVLQIVINAPKIVNVEVLSIWVKSIVLTIAAILLLITVELYNIELKKLKAQLV